MTPEQVNLLIEAIDGVHRAISFTWMTIWSIGWITIIIKWRN